MINSLNLPSNVRKALESNVSVLNINYLSIYVVSAVNSEYNNRRQHSVNFASTNKEIDLYLSNEGILEGLCDELSDDIDDISAPEYEYEIIEHGSDTEESYGSGFDEVDYDASVSTNMSMVPLLFRDWWDDFDRERPSRLLDQHFGLGLRRDDLLNNYPTSLLRPAGYFRPWRQLPRQNSGSSNVVANTDKVEVILDVQQFSPSEISVKTVDNAVVVEGKHEEKQDEHGYISRHFTRRYVLPKEVDVANIVSSLSSDGVLTITAPKKSLENKGERNVPIVQTGTPAVKPTETNIKVEQAS